jgi:hypothetical protein
VPGAAKLKPAAGQAGEELTFDYGLLNDAVLAYYGQPTPDCRGLKR